MMGALCPNSIPYYMNQTLLTTFWPSLPMFFVAAMYMLLHAHECVYIDHSFFLYVDCQLRALGSLLVTMAPSDYPPWVSQLESMNMFLSYHVYTLYLPFSPWDQGRCMAVTCLPSSFTLIHCSTRRSATGEDDPAISSSGYGTNL